MRSAFPTLQPRPKHKTMEVLPGPQLNTAPQGEVCQRCAAINWSGSGLGLHHNLELGHQDDEEIYADRWITIDDNTESLRRSSCRICCFLAGLISAWESTTVDAPTVLYWSESHLPWPEEKCYIKLFRGLHRTYNRSFNSDPPSGIYVSRQGLAKNPLSKRCWFQTGAEKNHRMRKSWRSMFLGPANAYRRHIGNRL